MHINNERNKNTNEKISFVFLCFGLFSEFEFCDKFLISSIIFLLKIVKKFSSFCYHEHNTTTWMVIFFMNIQMKFEIFNPFRKNSYLYFWRTSITFMSSELLHKSLLVVFFECHRPRYYNKIKNFQNQKIRQKWNRRTIWKTEKKANLFDLFDDIFCLIFLHWHFFTSPSPSL